MGFGAIIASGKNNQLMRDDLLDSITEVRVEQSLDDPTRFAIRFQEDVSGGNPLIMKAPELQCGQMITIAVQAGGETKCLVRGPITNVKSSVMLGGPGSWYQIHGQDRRIELDRQCKRRCWVGLESDAAARILNDEYKFAKLCIQKTQKLYGTARQGANREITTETLNQRDTDEAFLRQIACRNNLHFWIEYKATHNGLDPNGMLKVVEIANLRSSPLRPVDAEEVVGCEDRVELKAKDKIKLRVNVENEQCQSVTSFNLTMDTERPSRFSGSALDDRDGRPPHLIMADNRQPAIAKGGRTLGNCQLDRDVCITTAGNAEELQRKAESALTEAGWFIEATANTTAHMLGGVLLPHDEVEIEGLGDEHSGRYQVKTVTHVINAADHFMDVQLRRNAFGGD